MTRFKSFNNDTCVKVLNLLELGYFRLREVVIKRIAVVACGVDDGGDDGTGCFAIELLTILRMMIMKGPRTLPWGYTVGAMVTVYIYVGARDVKIVFSDIRFSEAKIRFFFDYRLSSDVRNWFRRASSTDDESGSGSTR